MCNKLVQVYDVLCDSAQFWYMIWTDLYFQTWSVYDFVKYVISENVI